MSNEITINNTAAEIKAAMDAENERRHSPEVIGAAVQEFTQRTGYQDNAYTAAEIARSLGNREPTADNLQRAAEERLAWETKPEDLWKLRRYINGE
ncbi:MAG: hypothetical protein ABSG52_14475 [Terriglobales bacterium]|jgi:hypothetical protein